MREYIIQPVSSQKYKQFTIHSFLGKEVENIDQKTVDSFGEEWTKFSQFSDEEISRIGPDYFDLVNLAELKTKVVLDVGCGSGRWAKFLSPYAAGIEAIDPSVAVFSAAELLSKCTNVRVTRAGVDGVPFRAESFDLVYSLGVLHHVPDTALAVQRCADMVKPGGSLLLYLYYNLENRGSVYKTLFRISNVGRKIISSMPGPGKRAACDLIAALIYWPMVQMSRLISFVSASAAERMPLSYYRKTDYRIMRNDALDRFGTPLEKRFSRSEISKMLSDAKLTDITFSEQKPYWHVIARKR